MPVGSSDAKASRTSHRDELRALLIRFGIELVVYGALLTVYFLLVLRFLSAPLNRLAINHPGLYSWLGLVLIVAQAVVLDAVTSLLVEQLHMERVE